MGNLFKGSAGPEVKKLQQKLNQLNGSALPKLIEDGVFGANTLARVIEFQKSKGLVPDGVAGPQTKAALGLTPGPANGSAPLPGGVSTLPNHNTGDIVSTVVAAVDSAIRTWKASAGFRGISITGPIANGGFVNGPHLGSLMAAAVSANLQGEDRRIGAAAVSAIGECFASWQATVRVPGLMWYPAFAAVNAPIAGPAPSVSCPLGALQSVSSLINTPGAIQSRILASVGASSRPDASSIIAQIASEVSMRFGQFLSRTVVRNVVGSGPVPEFAPPMCPSGRVIGGSAYGGPGCFA